MLDCSYTSTSPILKTLVSVESCCNFTFRTDNNKEGDLEGLAEVGDALGLKLVGDLEGLAEVGDALGLKLVGDLEGLGEGKKDGDPVGLELKLGKLLPLKLGESVGPKLTDGEAELVGETVGAYA